MSAISILYGLGNPGDRYCTTRHNIGSEVLDFIATRYALRWKRAPGPVMESRWDFSEKRIILLKPLVYMNVTGRALSRRGDVDPSTLLIVCDDINLPLGVLRIRTSGGTGGHRGLESIIDELGTENFARLRLGIGAPQPEVEWSDYVLERFQDREMDIMERMVERATDAVEAVIRDGLDDAMQEYNRKPPLSSLS